MGCDTLFGMTSLFVRSDTWQQCVLEENAQLLDTLQPILPLEAGLEVLTGGTPWLLNALIQRGLGPETWPVEAWVGSFKKANDSYAEAVAHAIGTLRGGGAILEAHTLNALLVEDQMWNLTGEHALEKMGLEDWTACLKEAMDHGYEEVFVRWLDRTKAAGVALENVVVPLEGTLLRRAWVHRKHKAAEALVAAGVRLTSPEPFVNKAWSAEGWTLARQLSVAAASAVEGNGFPVEWVPLLRKGEAQEREEALEVQLPIPAVRARGPRF